MNVREARPEELPTVATILDAAMLETDDLEARVNAGDVLVAVESETGIERTSSADATGRSGDERVLGALVLEPPVSAPAWARNHGTAGHVAAIAVRRRRRGQGIGTALVEAAAASLEATVPSAETTVPSAKATVPSAEAAPSVEPAGPLTAEFDAPVRPFYEEVGFEIIRSEGGRFWGILRERSSPNERDTD